ncbi:alanine racemase C-terminal domain-containing protein [Microbacterium sp. JB110]|uniref:alanine racemase C-terminal domain-containing protein n=1 Tax=Microbacterium sp. JB110 TaxID=2024477 RepID=UPI0021637CED|nr:alanine racemase C-terminal domain-containing protein [Microbacterium sp. JB110]
MFYFQVVRHRMLLESRRHRLTSTGAARREATLVRMNVEPIRSEAMVRVSRGALRENIASILRGATDIAIDVRRDACGHGADLVAGVAHELGIRIFAEGDDPHGARSLAPLDAVYGLTGRGVPAMTLVAPVLSTKPLLQGEGVSYGYRFTAERDTRIALVSGGYAQGLVRAIGGTAEVLLNGARCRIVGRVAMDVHVVDLEGADAVAGDEATLFGAADPQLLAAWAHATGMTELELAACVGLGVEREVVA